MALHLLSGSVKPSSVWMNWWWKSPQALWHDHESENFSQEGLAQCIWSCCWGRGSSISQPDERQVTRASWAHLTVENYERGVKDLASIGTARNTTAIPEQYSKAEENRKLEWETHIAADSRRWCPEPRPRAINVEMVYCEERSIGSRMKILISVAKTLILQSCSEVTKCIGLVYSTSKSIYLVSSMEALERDFFSVVEPQWHGDCLVGDCLGGKLPDWQNTTKEENRNRSLSVQSASCRTMQTQHVQEVEIHQLFSKKARRRQDIRPDLANYSAFHFLFLWSSEHRPNFGPVKLWVAQLKRGIVFVFYQLFLPCKHWAPVMGGGGGNTLLIHFVSSRKRHVRYREWKSSEASKPSEVNVSFQPFSHKCPLPALKQQESFHWSDKLRTCMCSFNWQSTAFQQGVILGFVEGRPKAVKRTTTQLIGPFVWL